MHSPTHLVDFLACKHLSDRERAARAKLVKKPFFDDPLTEVLRRQGQEHEREYLEKLKAQGLTIFEIPEGENAKRSESTIQAIKTGADVIYQGSLSDGNWHGYADFLVKVNTSSNLGEWSYNVVDTKLSSEAKGGALLQLCVYVDLLAKIQGRLSDEITIALGSGEVRSFNPESYTAYFRYIREKFELAAKEEPDLESKMAPEPVEKCQICDWRGSCEDYWHKNDTLNLVAGLSKNQRKILEETGVKTLAAFAELGDLPKVKYSQLESLRKAHLQAKIQLKGRQSGNISEFILPVQADQGLAALPEPSEGDIWFDIEGDPHIGREGLEYLLGWTVLEKGKPRYYAAWAQDRGEEKRAFEIFIQFVLERMKKYPGMYVYHFGHYEKTAVQKLSTRHDTFVEEVDDLLRLEKFVDLHRVLKNGLRLSCEGYGLKEIEDHYGFKRKTELHSAGRARKAITLALDFKKEPFEELKEVVERYNEEDCLSTFKLHHWLEDKRTELVSGGTPVPRRSAPSLPEKKNEELEELSILAKKLHEKLPENPEDWNEYEKATQVLADLLLWFRREGKSYWWEFFRLRDLNPAEAMDEGRAIGGLKFEKIVGKVKQSQIYRFTFPPQHLERRREKWNTCSQESTDLKEAYNLDIEQGVIDFKWGKTLSTRVFNNAKNCNAIFASKKVDADHQIARLKELGEWVLEKGLEDVPGEEKAKFRVARSMLLKLQIIEEGGEEPLRKKREDTLETAQRLSLLLGDGAVLPVQGPPGSGKTFTGAHMILELIKAGKKVGITAQSHAVIMNLLKSAVKLANERGLNPVFLKQESSSNPQEKEENSDSGIEFVQSGKIAARDDADVIGGTAWLWSRPEMSLKVDVLFIDEGGQFSLADTLAVSHAASSMVLLGDPQQLENVTVGVHPPEVEVSALGYWLKDEELISPDRGLFLDQTYRMHPGLTEYISEVFYRNKLGSAPDLEKQEIIIGKDGLNGSGLRFYPVKHTGNQSSSEEEATRIQELVGTFTGGGKWRDKDGNVRDLTLEDILIVAPYNSQVEHIRSLMPDAKVGTVDKFQGQEAPIVIYSMTTSTPDEAPRGMEFLYSNNRLNVALSRARCLALLVASPDLFELECHTPRQMELANAFCRFLEIAKDMTFDK